MHSFSPNVLSVPAEVKLPTNTRFVCEAPLLPMCDKYAHRCHEHAQCVGNFTWYTCNCNEGYTGNGEICVELGSCPESWANFETSCYLLQIETISFYKAELSCQNHGGHLVSVHSDDEMDFIRNLLSPHGDIKVWFGRRISYKGTSFIKNNCLWTDGTDCNFSATGSNSTTPDVNGECLVYRTTTNLWELDQCTARMYHDGTAHGFVCKINLHPKFLNVKMASQSFVVYPGFAEMIINGKKVDWESDDQKKLEKGLIHLATLDKVGTPLFTASVSTDDGTNMDPVLENFATTNIAEPKVSYIALATSGKFNPELWNLFQSKMTAVPLRQGMYGIQYEDATQDADFSVTEDSRALLGCQGSTCADCWGPVIFSKNGEPTCRMYTDSNGDSYGYTSKSLIWNHNRYKKRVRYRSKTLSEVGETSTLICPWLSTKLQSMGFNVVIVDADTSPPHSNATCTAPPCVHQIACQTFDVADDPSVVNTWVFDSYLLFCKRFQTTGKFYCHINQGSNIFGDNKAEVTLKLPLPSAPLLATFDDLIHLGSIPFEFGTTHPIKELAWKASNWKWTDTQFPVLIDGVRDRAIRISSQEVKTQGNVCWGKLGGPRCPDGFSLSFWIRIVSFPNSGHSIVLNTGGIGTSTSCSGLGVYITNGYLHVVVKALGKAWNTDISIQIKKWTYIHLSWDPKDTSTATNQTAAILNGTTSCDSELRIGGRFNSGIFDIDDLYFFDEFLSSDDYAQVTTTDLPHRHKLFGSSHSYSYSTPITFKSGTSCSSNTINDHRGCADFGQTCPGSSMYCKLGLTVAFHVELEETPENNKRVLLISNLPSGVVSLGFRVEAYQSSTDDSLWEVELKHTFTENGGYQSKKMSFLMGTGVKYMFWVQMSPSWEWSFCMLYPTDCVYHSGVFPTGFPTDSDSHTELMVGPVKIAATTIQIDWVKMTDVWLIEQSLDLMMVADEVRMGEPPIHWMAHSSNDFSSRYGHQFEVKGLQSEMSASYDGPVGPRLGFWNNRIELATAQQAGEDLETRAGWLELDTTSITCLHNIDLCEDGFTIQFWLLVHECRVADLENDDECVYLSTGGHAAPLSRGFTFSQIVSKAIYQVVVSTSERLWRIKFKADFKTLYSLVRISWQKDAGLSLFLNDILMHRATDWDSISPLSSASGGTLSAEYYDPFTSLTIGRRNDHLSGFSTFRLADIHFWSNLVEGAPFRMLGDVCRKNWRQIGSMCYYHKSGTYTHSQAESACNAFADGSTLPILNSLSLYEYFADIVGLTVSTYWLDLSRVDNGEKYRWNFIQRTVESMSFDSFMNLSSATDSAKFFSKTGVYGYPDALWSYDQNTNAQLICQLPLVKDYLHQGCYNFDNDLSNHNHLMVNLHYPTNHSANSNSIGSYSLPQACMAVCYEKFNSSVSALASWKCNCMNSNFKTTELAGLTLLDKSDCSSSFFLAQNQQTSLGYSNLNFPLSSTKDLSYIPGEYCGATEWGGGYKCGINILGQQRSAVYATSTNLTVYMQVFPASVISYVISPTNTPDIQQVVTYLITTLKCGNSKNPSSNCADDELLWFHISFGDGSELENFYFPDSLLASRFVHAYNTSGVKHITTTVKNMAKYDAVSKTSTIKVLPSIEKVELYSVELDLVQPGQLAVITTIGLSGTHMQCTWVYGDESPPETLSLEQLPIPTTYHRYQEAGEFIVKVLCWNRLQSRSVQTLAVVHMLIHGLQSATDAVVEYGQPYLHTWRIIQGSHIDCLVFFGNKSLTEVTQDYFEDVQNSDEAMMYYNSDTKEGHARIPTQLYIQDPQNSDRCLLPGEATTYTLLVSCYNGVTDPPSIATYVTFEVPVSGFTLTSEKQIAQVNEEICKRKYLIWEQYYS
ncbi:uncharacterized protein LOC144742552 [Ciona intestinalis]